MIQVELKIPEFFDNVQGCYSAGTQRHGPLLYGLVRWLMPSVVVEVGSLGGYTAAWMARALFENGHGALWCIDDFSLVPGGREKLANNLEQLGVYDRVTILEGRSDLVVWPTPVDLAFIDGDHSYQGCLADVLRAVKNGAKCIVVHDTVGWWGPRQVVDGFRNGDYPELMDYDFMECMFDSGLAVFKKREAKPDVTYLESKYPTGAIDAVEAATVPVVTEEVTSNV